VNEITDEEIGQAVTPNSKFATGGIVTKLKAAEYIIDHKRKMFLCSGYDLTAARDYLIDGIHNKGTLFQAKETNDNKNKK
ncbi:MAG: glutamate 5-kinase, partial [Arcobacteraceae bacterium]